MNIVFLGRCLTSLYYIKYLQYADQHLLAGILASYCEPPIFICPTFAFFYYLLLCTRDYLSPCSFVCCSIAIRIGDEIPFLSAAFSSEFFLLDACIPCNLRGGIVVGYFDFLNSCDADSISFLKREGSTATQRGIDVVRLLIFYIQSNHQEYLI